MLSPIRTRLVLQNGIDCELGRLSLAGYIKNNLGVSEHNQRILGSYALVYLLEGSGFFIPRPGERLQVSAGDLLLLFPDVPHAYGPGPNESWSEFHIVFTCPIFDLWRKSGLISEMQPVIHLEPIEYWLTYLESVLPSSDQMSRLEMVQSLSRLQQFFAEALVRAPGQISTHPAWFEKSCHMLRKSPETEIDLEKLAKSVGLSYESFRKQFKQISGTSPGRYRSLQVMNRACQLIYEKWMTNKQIATELHFCDEFHFAKSFRKIIGLSPREFRRQLPHMKR